MKLCFNAFLVTTSTADIEQCIELSLQHNILVLKVAIKLPFGHLMEQITWQLAQIWERCIYISIFASTSSQSVCLLV